VLETEIKLAVEDLDALRLKLTALGWTPAVERALERNSVYDSADQRLFAEGKLLRVREIRGRGILTVKLPTQAQGRHKVREEHEAEGEPAALHGIVEGLGYRLAWRYEKYRTPWRRQGARGVIEVDETPLGNFVELEGDPQWIDETAAALGFRPEDAITANYQSLFVAWKRETGRNDQNLLFEDPADAC
jgi:adenylate cyclase class 2